MLHLSAGVLIGFGLAGCSFNARARRLRQAAAGSTGAHRLRRRHGGRLVRPVSVLAARSRPDRQLRLAADAAGLCGDRAVIMPLAFVLSAPAGMACSAGMAAEQSFREALARGVRPSLLHLAGARLLHLRLPARSSSPCICPPILSIAASGPGRRLDARLIGLFNIVGSLRVRLLGNRMPKRYLLSSSTFRARVAIARLPPAAGQRRPRIGVRRRDGPAVAVDRAADLGARRADVRHALAGDAATASSSSRHQVGGFLGVWLGGCALRAHRLLRRGLVGSIVLRRRLGADQPADRERPVVRPEPARSLAA